MNNKPRINITYDYETFREISNLAAKLGMKNAELVRDWSIQGLSGTLNKENMDLIAHIVREQLQSILNPQINRLATLNAKTCIQASTAAYLTAEAILKFVPPNRQQEVEESYLAARKKGIEYTKRGTDLDI